MKYAFKRLQELGPEVIAEVDQRLIAGETPTAVAKYLQEELKVFKDIKTASLKKNLERYRAADLKEKVVSQMVEATTGKSVVKVAGTFNAMIEMEKLAAIQTERCMKLITHEQNLPGGIINQVASGELRLLKEITTELGKLQLETGIIQRAPKKVSGSTFDPATGETKDFKWTEEYDRLMQTLEGVEYTEVEVEDAE